MITTATKQTYQKDRALEDKFSKTIKGILGNVFITKDIQMDLLHGTDFLTLTVNPFKVAVRLRRQDGNFERYKKEFTIRWSRPSGIETEIHKIKKGLVDYIFYGFVGKEETANFWMLEWIVSNPSSTKEEIMRCFPELTAHVREAAKASGARFVYTTTNRPRLIEKLTAAGFKIDCDNITQLFMEV